MVNVRTVLPFLLHEIHFAQVYLHGLQKAAQKDSKFGVDVVNKIFGNLEQLLMINDQLCTELEERLEKWLEPGQDHIGDILAKKVSKSDFVISTRAVLFSS